MKLQDFIQKHLNTDQRVILMGLSFDKLDEFKKTIMSRLLTPLCVHNGNTLAPSPFTDFRYKTTLLSFTDSSRYPSDVKPIPTDDLICAGEDFFKTGLNEKLPIIDSFIFETY